MSYERIFQKPYPTGYKDKPNKTTPITGQTLNDKDNTLVHLEDYLSNNEFSQLEELPEASEEILGKIYQYIGETDEDFTQGYFYKCVIDESENYIWENIQVQQGGGGGDTNSWVGTLAEYNAQKDDIPDGTFVGITDDPTGGGGGPIDASNVTFDNTGTEMESTNVQDAIKELYNSGSGTPVTFYKADWVGTSSSSIGVRLTNSLVLPAGKYIIFVHSPYSLGNFTYYTVRFNINGSFIENTVRSILNSHGEAMLIAEFTEETTIYLESAASTQTMSWDSQYLSRGGLEAIKLA